MLKINSKLRSIYSNQYETKGSYLRNSSVPKRGEFVIEEGEGRGGKRDMNVRKSIDVGKLGEGTFGRKRGSFGGKESEENGCESIGSGSGVKAFLPKLSQGQKTNFAEYLAKQPFLVGNSAFGERNQSVVLDPNFESMFNTNESRNEVSKPKKPQKKQSSIGLFSDLDTRKPVYDMSVYARVLNQQLTKMNNKFLAEKYKAYVELKKKRLKEVRNSHKF